MAIANNTTHLYGIDGVIDYGMTIKERWIDLSIPKEEPKEEDTRPADEIASDIWERIRGH